MSARPVKSAEGRIEPLTLSPPLADRVLVIGDGRILAEEPAGTPREVLFGHLGV